MKIIKNVFALWEILNSDLLKNRAGRMFENLLCEIFLRLTNSNTNDLELMKKNISLEICL